MGTFWEKLEPICSFALCGEGDILFFWLTTKLIKKKGDQ